METWRRSAAATISSKPASVARRRSFWRDARTKERWRSAVRVSVFGLGYVGCVTAACLAKTGHEVIGVDVNPDKVSLLNDASPPVVEPGLGELLREVVGEGRLCATTDPKEAVERSDVALICVGTPGRANGQLDAEAIERVGRELGLARAGGAEPFTVVPRS